MTEIACRFCGEVKPFSWLGGTHCSPWRVAKGYDALKDEDWPPAQSGIIQRERLIREFNLREQRTNLT